MATPSSEDEGNIPQSLIFNGKNWVNPPSGSTSTSGTQFNTEELNERQLYFFIIHSFETSISSSILLRPN